MGRRCTVCSHSQRGVIDAALVNGAPRLGLAQMHALSEGSVRRHADRHLPATLVRAQETVDAAEADDLLALARRLQREALDVLARAKAQGNLGGVLQAIDRLQKGAALLSTLAERGVGEGREIVFRWQECPHHDEGECELTRSPA